MTTPAYSRGDVDRARRMVRLLIEHYFGSKPHRLVHKGTGMSNTVFEVHHAEGEFIVRVAPGTSGLDSFLKEQWSVGRVREAGVPVPEILEVGQGVIPNPYMIQRLLRGKEATDHPDRLAVVHEVGQYARLINSIPTEGFGNTFDWSSNRLSFNNSFGDYLDAEFNRAGRLAILKKHKMLSTARLDKIETVLNKLAASKPASMLAHGDLRLKNVLVDDSGKIIAIIDWDNCCSAIAPAWDLAIALHDLSIDGKQAFIEGYGLALSDLDKTKQIIRVLNILHYAPYVQRAAEAKETARLAFYRMRLGGGLDLYAID